MSKVGIIIQARLGSSRLASKIAMKVTDQFNLIEYQLNQLIILSMPFVLAMPDTDEHRLFAKTLKIGKPIEVFFGDEHDVLKRFIDGATHFSFTSVVRICGDNPFLNIGFLKTLLNQWDEHYDYSTYYNVEGTPAMRTHFGLFSEIISVKALQKIQHATADKYCHEHVTPFLYEHADLFNLKKISMPEPFWSGLPLRLTVDTQADIQNVKKIMNGVENTQDWRAILAYCERQGLLDKMQMEINTNAK